MKMDGDEISFTSGWKGYLHRGIKILRFVTFYGKDKVLLF